jgi:hypothetical protein
MDYRILFLGAASTAIFFKKYIFGAVKHARRGYLLYKMISDTLDHSNSATGDDLSNFQVSNNGKNIKIEYKMLGTSKELYLPYDRSLITEMSQLYVQLIHSTDEHGNIEAANITQQPGIPYMSSALELGGDYILITNLDNGKETKYPADVIPKFCLEVL